MPEPVGSPTRNDPTARLEKIFNSGFDKASQLRDEMVDSVVNRPFGSTQQSNEEMLRDFEAIGGDEVLLAQRAQEMQAKDGMVPGSLAFTRWYLKGMELRGKRDAS